MDHLHTNSNTSHCLTYNFPVFQLDQGQLTINNLFVHKELFYSHTILRTTMLHLRVSSVIYAGPCIERRARDTQLKVNVPIMSYLSK